MSYRHPVWAASARSADRPQQSQKSDKPPTGQPVSECGPRPSPWSDGRPSSRFQRGAARRYRRREKRRSQADDNFARRPARPAVPGERQTGRVGSVLKAPTAGNRWVCRFTDAPSAVGDHGLVVHRRQGPSRRFTDVRGWARAGRGLAPAAARTQTAAVATSRTPQRLGRRGATGGMRRSGFAGAAVVVDARAAPPA